MYNITLHKTIGKAYCITCNDDGERILATRTIFKSLDEALAYQSTINIERIPTVHEVEYIGIKAY